MPEAQGIGLCSTTSGFIAELRRKHCFYPHQKLLQQSQVGLRILI